MESQRGRWVCHIINEIWNTHDQRTCLMFHAAWKVEFQLFNRSYSQLTFFNFLFFNFLCKKLKNVSCEYDRWMVELNFASCVVHHTRLYNTPEYVFLWTKPTIWLLIFSFTQNIVRACPMFYPYEGYRSVTPLDAARVNRPISHNHSVHWYYITLIKGRDDIKHGINVRRWYD